MLGSNPNEAKEFWSSTINFSSYTHSFFNLALIISITLSWYLITKHISISKYKEQFNKLITRLSILSMIICYPTGTIYFSIKTFVTGFTTGIDYGTLTTGERLLWGTYTIISEMQEVDKITEQLKDDNSIKVTKNKLPNHQVVLIIGESMRPDYMHCYGYNLENTPHLDSLIQKKGMYLFTDVVAPGHQTAKCIPEILSFKLEEEPEAWYEKASLPKIMSQAGYQTFWLSTQENYSAVVRSISAISHKLVDSCFYVKNDYDNEILPYVDKEITRTKGKNNFSIINLMGSHVNYADRYPKDFAKFRAKDIQTRLDVNNSQKENIANYVNSIYFNDYVVSEIIKKYDEEPSIIIYLSDHGQAIYDDQNNPNLAGHCLNLGGLSVPMMIYINDKMKEIYPTEKLAEIEKAQDKAFITDALPYAIMGLLDIQTSINNDQYNLFSEKYNVARKRMPHWGKRSFEVKHSCVDVSKIPSRQSAVKELAKP